MGEEVTNPILPEAYKSRSFNEVKLKELYGTGPTASQQRKFNKYLQSEQGQLAKFNFDKEESNKVFAAAEARMKARTEFYQKQRDAERAAQEQQKPQPSVTPVSTPEATPTPVKPVPVNWENRATQNGFSSMADVKQWQEYYNSLNSQKEGFTPLAVDGKFGNSSKTAYDAWKDSAAGKQYSVMMSKGATWDPAKRMWSNPKAVSTPAATPAVTPTTPAATPETNYNFVGEDSYYNLDSMQRAFDKLFNTYKNEAYSKYSNKGIGVGYNTAGLRSDPEYNDAWSNFQNQYKHRGFRETGLFGSSYVKLKQGGKMNKIKYFQQGGKPTAQAGQQDMQQQVIALVQAAMQGDQKATQTVNKIMEAAKAGDKQAMQIAQLIQQVAQKMQGQATTAKWGAKLSYIRSLKYAHGGKTCPSCDKGTKVKVAYKDIDKETYKKLPTDKQHAASMHAEHYASEYNKNGTYKTVHKPTAEDSTTIDKKHLSVNMKKKYTDKKECGGKAKKRYFGGWL